MGRWLSIGLLLAVSAGCAYTTASTSTATAPVPAVPVGRSVVVSGDGGRAQITLHSLRYHPSSSGPIHEAPVNGRYAVADVEVRGLAGRFDYNATFIGYQAASRRVYSFTDGHAVIAGYGPQLQSGTLGPGQSVRGFVTFDVPRGPGRDIQVSDPGGQIVAEWRLG